MASDIPERLLALAADARKQARELREDARAAVEQADKLETMAALWESQVGERSQSTPLHGPRQKSTVNTMLTPAHRIAISQGVDSRDKFLKHIRKHKPKGYTLRSLADALGIDPGLLSKHRSGKRPIPPARAAKIAELTDWPATDWPSIS